MRNYAKVIMATAVISVMTAVTAGATGISTPDAVYQRQGDGSYKYYETYTKEDGSKAKNEWIHYGDIYGSKVWKYYGADGSVLTNTTTPDGYLVNERGEWYEHCPSAAYCSVEEYFLENAYYPFSYDGSTFKNDYLGVTGTYNAADYQNGFNLNMVNSQSAMCHNAFDITAPSGGKASFCIYPTDLSTDAAIASWLGTEESVSSTSVTTPLEYTVAGKVFKGYQICITFSDHQTKAPAMGDRTSLGGQSSDGNEIQMNSYGSEVSAPGQTGKNRSSVYTVRLYSRSVNGGSMGIEMTQVSETDKTQILEWLNTHLTFQK